MSTRYHIDTKDYPLEKFKRNLKTRDLIPSRVSLKENLDESFKVLESQGIKSLHDLLTALKTKRAVTAFANKSGLDINYLTLLRREANSYLPNPVRLDKLAGIPSENFKKLAELGIKNTRHILSEAATDNQRKGLSMKTGIPVEVLVELVGLSDLTRVYGVGPVFARMIYDLGIRSLNDFARGSSEDFIRLYEEQTGKKADFGVGEIQFSLDMAKELEQIAEI